MKLDMNRRYNTIAVYAVLVVAVCAVVVGAVVKIKSILGFVGTIFSLLMPFVIGFVIAYILNPILDTAEHKLLPFLFKDKLSRKARRVIALILTYIFTLIIIMIFFRIVIPQIASSIASLAVQIPGWLSSAEALINRLIDQYNLLELDDSALVQITSTIEKVVLSLSTMLTNAIPQVWQATLSVTTGVLNSIVGIIISTYILLGKERFFAQTKKLLSALMPERVVIKLVEITHQSHAIFSGFISGKILDSCIIGVLCFIGMTLFRMPYAMLISVIVGVTNVIPYFGPFIGAIPSILILLIVDPIKAIWFGVFVLFLQQLDGNVIGPKILGDSTGLSAFWVIFSITVFGSLLGLIGMFIGVPLFAVIYSLVRQFCEWRLTVKGLPTATAEFASDSHGLMNTKEKRPKPKKVWKIPPSPGSSSK